MPEVRQVRRVRRARLVPAVPLLLAAPLLFAGCGGEEVGARPSLPTETPALWNPCDGLDTDFVAEQFGVRATKHAGTPTSPECRFTPEREGDAVLNANYQLFTGTLDDYWHAMGQAEGSDVREPSVPGADAARIVVAAEREQLYVTGFVQNGSLFEVVNVADPAPYDEARIVRGVRATLAALTVHADENGAGDPVAADPSDEE